MAIPLFLIGGVAATFAVTQHRKAEKKDLEQKREIEESQVPKKPSRTATTPSGKTALHSMALNPTTPNASTAGEQSIGSIVSKLKQEGVPEKNKSQELPITTKSGKNKKANFAEIKKLIINEKRYLLKTSKNNPNLVILEQGKSRRYLQLDKNGKNPKAIHPEEYHFHDQKLIGKETKGKTEVSYEDGRSETLTFKRNIEYKGKILTKTDEFKNGLEKITQYDGENKTYVQSYKGNIYADVTGPGGNLLFKLEKNEEGTYTYTKYDEQNSPEESYTIADPGTPPPLPHFPPTNYQTKTAFKATGDFTETSETRNKDGELIEEKVTTQNEYGVVTKEVVTTYKDGEKELTTTENYDPDSDSNSTTVEDHESGTKTTYYPKFRDQNKRSPSYGFVIEKTIAETKDGSKVITITGKHGKQTFNQTRSERGNVYIRGDKYYKKNPGRSEVEVSEEMYYTLLEEVEKGAKEKEEIDPEKNYLNEFKETSHAEGKKSRKDIFDHTITVDLSNHGSSSVISDEKTLSVKGNKKRVKLKDGKILEKTTIKAPGNQTLYVYQKTDLFGNKETLFLNEQGTRISKEEFYLRHSGKLRKGKDFITKKTPSGQIKRTFSGTQIIQEERGKDSYGNFTEIKTKQFENWEGQITTVLNIKNNKIESQLNHQYNKKGKIIKTEKRDPPSNSTGLDKLPNEIAPKTTTDYEYTKEGKLKNKITRDAQGVLQEGVLYRKDKKGKAQKITVKLSSEPGSYERQMKTSKRWGRPNLRVDFLTTPQVKELHGITVSENEDLVHQQAEQARRPPPPPPPPSSNIPPPPSSNIPPPPSSNIPPPPHGPPAKPASVNQNVRSSPPINHHSGLQFVPNPSDLKNKLRPAGERNHPPPIKPSSNPSAHGASGKDLQEQAGKLKPIKDGDHPSSKKKENKE